MVLIVNINCVLTWPVFFLTVFVFASLDPETEKWRFIGIFVVPGTEIVMNGPIVCQLLWEYIEKETKILLISRFLRGSKFWANLSLFTSYQASTATWQPIQFSLGLANLVVPSIAKSSPMK